MLKLISLELRKFKFGGYIFGAFIANLAILGMAILISFGTAKDGSFNPFTDFITASKIVDTYVKGTFIIFASVLIARLVVGEFKNKTITVLYTYPIKRKQLMVSKLLIVVVFTFLSAMISDIFITFVACFISMKGKILLDTATAGVIKECIKAFALSAFASTGMSLISLYFGMRKKSVPATIVSAVIIAVLMCSTIADGFTLSSIIAIPLTLVAIGALIAYLTIRNIERVDVSN